MNNLNCYAKNRSDRNAILSEQALGILTDYWYSFNRPTGWLFRKQNNPHKPIDTWFLSRHIHDQEQHLGWEHRMTCHSIRHAFGTHLYEDDADLLTIKALLGHKSFNSTIIYYVRLASNVFLQTVNPFDRIGGGSHGRS